MWIVELVGILEFDLWIVGFGSWMLVFGRGWLNLAFGLCIL